MIMINYSQATSFVVTIVSHIISENYDACLRLRQNKNCNGYVMRWLKDLALSDLLGQY